jgi:hypothetical protein
VRKKIISKGIDKKPVAWNRPWDEYTKNENNIDGGEPRNRFLHWTHSYQAL